MSAEGVQLFPIGKWRHPGGTIKITYDRARKFADGFNKKLAGQKLPILYIHSDKVNVANPLYGKAAGWISKVSADKKRGVVVDIDWTEAGAAAVESKEYQYLSAEFFDRVQLPHHDAPQEDILMGAALVNRPHLKGMSPILNEETGHLFIFTGESKPDGPEEGGGPMDPILLALAESAGVEVAEDATELDDEQREAVEKHLSGQTDQVTNLEAKLALIQKKLDDVEGPNSSKVRSLREAGFEEEATLLSEYRGDRLVRELESQVPKGHALTPAVEEEVRAFAIEGDTNRLTKALEIMAADKGIVDLTEHGSAGGSDDDDDASDSAGDKLNELADAYAKEHEMDWYAALEIVTDENPALWDEHQLAMREVSG
jgi:phage I-like protein